MAENERKPPRFGLKRLYRMFGIYSPTEMPKEKEQVDVQYSNYTPEELRHLSGFSKDPGDNNGPRSTDELSAYLKNVAGENQNTVREIASLGILTPEIRSARQVMVGAIMSPTDLQIGNINVTVDNTDLGEQVESDVSRICNDFFNNDLNLGERVAKWVGDALFLNGASCVMILPQANIRLLNDALDKQYGQTSGKAVSGESLKGGKSITCSLEGLQDQTYLTTSKALPEIVEEELIQEAVGSLEKLDAFAGMPNKEIVTHAKEARKAIKDMLKEKRSSIIVSSDVRVLNSSEDRLRRNLDKKTEEMNKCLIFDSMRPTMLLSTTMEDSLKDNCAIVEIPTTAVVPIIVPGSPHKHLGYFILVDQWGVPLTENRMDPGIWQGSRKATDQAMHAAFGKSAAITLSGDMAENQRYELTSKIFGLTIKNMMESKLEDYGLNGVTVSDHEAITNCMFRQLILKKKVGLIFVPESMMVYYRYDHHDDGTGKSLIEDMKTILSLRTMLLIAYVMAATENSIDHKTLEVNVDDKQANLEQYLDMVNQTFVEKKMMRFDNNPQTIMRDLTQKAVTIVPKGIRGLENSLNITTERRSVGAVTPDEGLLEKLTKWVISFLEIPAAAINETGENEYSRSVATTNMHFSNNIKTKQKVTNEHTTKLVRLMLMYNSPLREKIKSCLGVTEKDTDDVNAQSATEAKVTGAEVETNDDSVNKNLIKIIQNIHTTLPSPKIVVDKAQYEEIKNFVDSLDKVINDLFSEDMLGSVKSEYTDSINAFKAFIKADMLRNYIDNVGYQSTYEIPQLHLVNTDLAKEFFLRMINFKKGMEDMKAQIADKLNSGDAPEESTPDTGGSDLSTSSTEPENSPDLGNENPTNTGEDSGNSGDSGSIW